MNVQPVIPINLYKEWNLITRTILPTIKQPDLRTTSDDTWGVGNTSISAFLSPAKPGSIIWGAGPALLLPTGTDDVLSSGKWSAGASVVVLTTQGAWVFGILIQNVWSFAGSNDPPVVNQLLVQYFINYNLPGGWYLTSSPNIIANWEASSGNKWTVPVGGGFGKVFTIGGLPFNSNLAAFSSNVVRPDHGQD